MAQNRIEKIAEAHATGLAPGRRVRSGAFLTLAPAHVLTHDNTAAVIAKFRALGAERVHDPAQPVFALDHDVQNRDAANLERYAAIEAFAAEQGIAFHPAGRGIGHQVLCEEGFVLPGRLVVASDSHANLYGGLGALGTPVVRTDAAALWATGECWWQVPPVTRVELRGRLRAGVTGKDLILMLCARFGSGEVLGHALEIDGPGVASLSVDERLAIANMTTEWGALAGLFPADGRTLDWLRARLARLEDEGRNRGDLTAARLDAAERAPIAPDPGALYRQTIAVELDRVEPQVTGPDHVNVATPLAEIAARRQPIQKAYLLSCVNGRAEDFAQAAAVVDGRRVAEGVELWIAAASSEVEREVRRRGDWDRLVAAGARTLPAGCGPCIGLGAGLLEGGEVGISATNRNFRGRMGSRDAEVYLASPAIVAASALAGHVTGPAELLEVANAGDPARIEVHAAGPAPDETDELGEPTELLEGLPDLLRGEALLLDADDLDTDGIYARDVTYRDDLTPEDMARCAMANYDPGFQECVRAGDVLVAGAGFGAGSSREQAATCLVHLGLPLIVATSFSQTYERNAFNNGLPCIACPELVAELRARFGGQRPTVRTGLELEVDLARSEIRAGGRSYAFAPLGRAAQELLVAGGLEGLVRRRIGS